MLKAAFIMPHPPIVLPSVGGGREKEILATYNAMDTCAHMIAIAKPDTIVLTSPHAPAYDDYFHICLADKASGDMSRFGAPDVKAEVEYDTEFIADLEKSADKFGLHAGTKGGRSHDAFLDHGTLIPLAFVNKYYNEYKLARISLSGLSYEKHFTLGECIADCSEDRNVVFIASGDMSHKLKADGPYGFAEEGPLFDDAVCEIIKKGYLNFLMHINTDTVERAAECGLRSFIILAGALDGLHMKSELISYEGTFGVGYAVASFTQQ